jgi:3-phosphoshikimate 1-carboxyvinyltransferase
MNNVNSSTQFIVHPSGSLQGVLRVPGDKSISHRAIMLGALANGTTQISGFLEGEDTLATLAAFRAMGVSIEGPHRGQIILQGVGLHGLQPPEMPLYLGNSGTSMRLLAGLMAGQAFTVEMTGDSSLSRRPMRRVTEPLAMMGAQIETTVQGTPPLKIKGRQPLQGIDYQLPVASAQVKSCLLLAGLYAKGMTCVTEPAPTRDHTERLLTGFGYPIQRHGQRVCLVDGGQLQATTIDIPADISSAAFFMVGASIATGSEVLLEHVGINPTRIGIINILRQMGADIRLQNQREIGGEPVADILVLPSSLHGITIPEEQVPLAIDEFPIIFIAAACAQGETRLTGAAELRVKESDRIQVMAAGLQTLGIVAQPTNDGMVITGGKIQGGIIQSQGDHRIAMAFTIASLAARAPIIIEDCANVATSFPNFVHLAQQAGIDIQLKVSAN